MTSVRKRLLITGVSGLLGNCLATYFKDRYLVFGTYNRHAVSLAGVQTTGCDLTDDSETTRLCAAIRPAVIIHCASLTNVDECEHNRSRAWKLHVDVTATLVRIARQYQARFIYISTDAVYDGKSGHFKESDPVAPQNYYGETKLAGEKAVAAMQDSLILRTNIFGFNIIEKFSIAEWVLHNCRTGQRLGGFKDAFFSSIYTRELARAIDLALRCNLSGLYNCASRDSCSKYEFALKLAEQFDLDITSIEPVSIDSHSFVARRGKDLSLDVSRIEAALGYKLPGIDESIRSYYRDSFVRPAGDGKPAVATAPEKTGFLPYGRQSIDEADIEAVTRVLRSDRITQGPRISEFERKLADYCGARYAVAVNSGTSALHIACKAAGIKEGDEAITSPNTFVASANCAVYCGGKVVFPDIDPRTYNLSPESIAAALSPKTRVVIPVHFAGQSCDMQGIAAAVARAREKFGSNICIIEDGCHAQGSRYRDRRVGSCTWSDMTVLSFHPVKHITTGEGGVVLTNDKGLLRQLQKYRSHGITSDFDEFINPASAMDIDVDTGLPQRRMWYYEQQELGYNYRITDIQCALGISQLQKLDVFCEKRRMIWERYNRAFESLPHVQTPFERDDCISNFHLYVMLFDFTKLGFTRARFMQMLLNEGIQTQVHYIPVPMQPFYRHYFHTDPANCPVAAAYYEKCLSLPLHPSMQASDIDKVITTITRIVGA